METVFPRIFLQHRFAKPLAWTACILIGIGAIAVFLQWLIFMLAFDADALPPIHVGRTAPDPTGTGAPTRSIVSRCSMSCTGCRTPDHQPVVCVRSAVTVAAIEGGMGGGPEP